MRQTEYNLYRMDRVNLGFRLNCRGHRVAYVRKCLGLGG
jgi:hypothetical protein